MTPAAVVIPTIGRPVQLRAALDSLARCQPRPAEVVVVDQSGGQDVRSVVESFTGPLGARWLRSDARSIGLAVNVGLEYAEHDLVFVTNDDCVVAPDWIGVGQRELAATPGAIVTGAVHPVGDPVLTPSLKEESRPWDYTGAPTDSALYGANMATSRAAILELGGFDPRVVPSGEDNDLGYRWLRAGRTLRYVPELRIWHDDWRSEAEMKDLYLRYGVGQGMFYAKHLRRRDARMLRFLARDVRYAGQDALRAVIRGEPVSDWAKGTLRGLPAGLRAGWRTFRSEPRG